jgi:hypothetical protein
MSNTIPAVPRRLKLPRKLPQTQKENSAYLDNLTKAIDDQNDQIATTMTSMVGANVLAQRPTPAQNGWLYYATDVAHLYVAFNSAWITVV